MKKRILILMVFVVCAVLVFVTLASASSGPTASSSTASGTMSGGHYQLISAPSPETILASGGGYRLLPSIPAVDPAAGCCCKTNLPCVRK